jgi:flotillin
MPQDTIILASVIVGLIFFLTIIASRFLRTVEAGTIRLVSSMGGATKIYKGPGKSWEIPLWTTGTTIPSKAINIDLDIADQTADVDRNGQPRPIKVRVLASAIVSVGDSNETIRTAANRFFAKPENEQTSTLTDLLTSTGRRAINLLHHDELFNAKASFPVDAGEIPTALVKPLTSAVVAADDDDRLAIIIKSACCRELQDLGLVFNSLNIKEVQSEVAEARRRQSAVEAKANADIVQADQERRSREAQLGAEQAVNDKQRDLEQRRAENAAVIANAEALKQAALEALRTAELRATQIAQAVADAEKLKVNAEANAEAEAIKLRTVASAQADAIRLVNKAIAEGGDAYLTLRQLEMLPQIAPVIANALAQARLVNISSDGRSAAGGAADQITGVIQTILAAQLVSGTLKLDGTPPAALPSQAPAASTDSTPAPASTAPAIERSAQPKLPQPAPQAPRPPITKSQ